MSGDSRTRLLAEMGIKPVWRLRQSAADEKPQPAASASRDDASLEATVHGAAAPQAIAPDRAVPPASGSVPALTDARPVAAGLVASLGWDALEETIRDCRACALCERRKRTVPGVGDRQADWLFVGEGPGAEEDERGEPFVGQAGRLLDAMLATIGLDRHKDVYIANAVKCRPPGNRTPEASEIATCHPFLERQVALLQPRLIVALGRPAAQTLLGGELKISASRGRLFDYRGIPVVVTYHPAYLLRNLTDKARAWEDLCFAQDTMEKLRQS